MLPDPVAAASAVEKLGIIGVLALIIILVGYTAWHFRKEAVAAHKLRENQLAVALKLREDQAAAYQKAIDDLKDDIGTLKQMLLIVKLAADQAGAKYDLRDVGDLDALLRMER